MSHRDITGPHALRMRGDFAIARATAVILCVALVGPPARAQQRPAASTRLALPEPKNWTTAQDHRDMMARLGIRALRPGPSGNEQNPNHANYDETKANPCPRLPEPFTLRDGRKVTTPRLWARRRAEIVEDFEREVYGRVPQNVPRVAWTVAEAETTPEVNAQQVGVEGVSRYGKAALLTMAFDPRFAAVLIGSSGAGGAKPHRRNSGEAVENLTGSGEYHWMAGDFLKYGASEATFGSRNAGDIPVDAHQLLALCAPRLTFVSYGVPERGDAEWLDQQGSFMAAVAAQPAFRLLGAKDLGRSDDYMREKLPPVNVGLLDGQLAWRQHDGGHTDGPNWKYFLSWADYHFRRRYTPAPPVPASAQLAGGPAQGPGRADVPVARTDSNSVLAHRQLLAKRTQGKIDVYFIGNSITRRWGATDYPEFLANWKANFHGWNAANFGWGADRIEHMLWRIENGELDGVNPRVIVILAGTNNVGQRPGGDEKVADITRGMRALIDLCRRKAPNATIIITGILPRNDNIAVVPEIERINENIARFADGRSIRYLDINDKLADANGRLFEGMAVDGLHLSLEGYQVWADALKPMLTELLGPPAATDQAPPPTGDPSARRP